MARRTSTRTGIASALGSLETRIMRTLWQADELLTVGQVRQAMRGKALAYTTVMTSLNRLAAKGLVARRRSPVHWGYAYQAKTTPEELAADVARRVIQEIAPGRLEPAVCLLLGLDPKTCARQLAALRHAQGRPAQARKGHPERSRGAALRRKRSKR
jgi:predicted transcriptional regulator